MIRILFAFMLAAASALAQAQSTATPKGTAGTQTQPSGRPTQQPGILTPLPSATQPNTAASVPATAPVITLHGVCDNPQAGSADCTTVVTKAQFEKLVDAINTNNQPIPPQMRRNLAQAYVELNAFAQAAEKAGVQNDPRFQEVMRLVRMRTLADIYRRDFEEKNRTASPQDVEAYYKQNVSKYEEVKLGRIFIPKNNPTGQDKAEFEKKAEQIANDVHARAAKGEDLEKLQKDAYTQLGLTTPAPSTEAGTRRKGMMLPQEEAEVFALQPGGLSKVEAEPTGFVIYKLESRQTVPLDQVKDEISRELFRQKMEAQMKSVTASVHADYNDQYFGQPPSTAPGTPGSAAAAPPSLNQPKTPTASAPRSSGQTKKTPPQ